MSIVIFAKGRRFRTVPPLGCGSDEERGGCKALAHVACSDSQVESAGSENPEPMSHRWDERLRPLALTTFPESTLLPIPRRATRRAMSSPAAAAVRHAGPAAAPAFGEGMVGMGRGTHTPAAAKHLHWKNGGKTLGSPFGKPWNGPGLQSSRND
eukprot:gene12082-biopygen2593